MGIHQRSDRLGKDTEPYQQFMGSALGQDTMHWALNLRRHTATCNLKSEISNHKSSEAWRFIGTTLVRSMVGRSTGLEPGNTADLVVYAPKNGAYAPLSLPRPLLFSLENAQTIEARLLAGGDGDGDSELGIFGLGIGDLGRFPARRITEVIAFFDLDLLSARGEG
jgi:hypothetical protein